MDLCESKSKVSNATPAMMAALSRVEGLIRDLLECEAKVSSVTQAMLAGEKNSCESYFGQLLTNNKTHLNHTTVRTS